MSLEVYNYYRDSQSMYNDCKRLLNFHVVITLTDGSMMDGIVQDVDSDRVMMLVGEEVMDEEQEMQPEHKRQFGRPRMGFRRFVPRPFPLRTLAAISLLRYPFIVPPFPYYPFWF